MKKLVAWCDSCAVLGGYFSGLIVCLGLGLTLVEIVLRTFFDRTLYVAEEYAGYFMCALTFCALAYTLKERGHIRMTFLHKAIRGRKRVILDTVCYIIGLLFCIYLSYFTFLFFWDSAIVGSQSMQISETYLAIPQFFLFIGALMLTFQFLGEFLRSILMLKGVIDPNEFINEQEDLGR
jgi:TRAP-type C4-dicarboxylate transport system permease small subunit